MDIDVLMGLIGRIVVCWLGSIVVVGVVAILKKGYEVSGLRELINKSELVFGVNLIHILMSFVILITGYDMGFVGSLLLIVSYVGWMHCCIFEAMSKEMLEEMSDFYEIG